MRPSHLLRKDWQTIKLNFRKKKWKKKKESATETSQSAVGYWMSLNTAILRILQGREIRVFLHIHNTAIKNSIKTHSSAFWEIQSASVLKITRSHNATITLSDVMWKPRPLSSSSLLQERKQLLCLTSRKAFALVLASPADLLPQISSSWTREPLTGFLLDLQAELWLKQQDMSTFLYFLRLK